MRRIIGKKYCVFGHQNVRNDLFWKSSVKATVPMIVLTQILVNFLGLRGLQTNDLNLYRRASSCMFDIDQMFDQKIDQPINQPNKYINIMQVLTCC